SPGCNGGRTVAPLRSPFVDNKIIPALLSPAALAVAAKLPATANSCGQVFTGVPNHQNEAQVPVRIDFQVNQKQTIFARYMLTTDSRVIPYDLASSDILTTGSQGPAAIVSGTDDTAHSLTFGHTYVISSSKVNSFRVVSNYVSVRKPGPSFFSPGDVGINAYTYVPGYTTLRVLNNFNVGGGNFTANVTGSIKSYGVSDDFTVVSGAHQFAYGGHFLRGASDT